LPRIEKSALVPFSGQAMFELVKDVDRYKEFLPWCVDSELLSHEGNRICGRIEVARMGVRQAFSTCNTYQEPRHMDIELREGPFKSLHGAWDFVPLREDACKVVLVLNFEFSNKLMNAAFGKVFHQLANTLVESFCTRAREKYGE
jgi:ribosome-associated toxin RatA of RatAB toxin-antitoxin module